MATVRYDVTYTNGVIASREKYLLKEKLNRLCELSAEEAFRTLLESGFGGGAETTSSLYEFEKLVAEEEARLDAFIREYAPSRAEATYLLAPRDFHNAKAIVKAVYLGESTEKMLAPAGLLDVAVLEKCIREQDFSALGKGNEALIRACMDATALLQEDASGAKVGAIFDKALYMYLRETVKGRSVLKKLLTAKVDMTNILTAFRAQEQTEAMEKYLPTGSLSADTLGLLFADENTAIQAFKRTAYADFVKNCLLARGKGLPLSQAEKLRDGYDIAYFAERKYELSKTEPFLYYVYRRKTEIANVRITFVCLLAGLDEQDIKRRLRTV